MPSTLPQLCSSARRCRRRFTRTTTRERSADGDERYHYRGGPCALNRALVAAGHAPALAEELERMWRESEARRSSPPTPSRPPSYSWRRCSRTRCALARAPPPKTRPPSQTTALASRSFEAPRGSLRRASLRPVRTPRARDRSGRRVVRARGRARLRRNHRRVPVRRRPEPAPAPSRTFALHRAARHLRSAPGRTRARPRGVDDPPRHVVREGDGWRLGDVEPTRAARSNSFANRTRDFRIPTASNQPARSSTPGE